MLKELIKTGFRAIEMSCDLEPTVVVCRPYTCSPSSITWLLPYTGRLYYCIVAIYRATVLLYCCHIQGTLSINHTQNLGRGACILFT